MAFVLAPPLRGDLDGALATLRAAAGIARALSASLVLPRWRTPSGAWMAMSEGLVDVAALAAVVPLLSEAEARTRTATLPQEDVRIVEVRPTDSTLMAGTHLDMTALEEYLRASGLSILLPGQSPAVLELDAPMRCRADVVAHLGGAAVLVLPALPGTAALSASASVWNAPMRRKLDRALATPALAVRHLAGALLEEQAIAMSWAPSVGLEVDQARANTLDVGLDNVRLVVLCPPAAYEDVNEAARGSSADSVLTALIEGTKALLDGQPPPAAVPAVARAAAAGRSGASPAAASTGPLSAALAAHSQALALALAAAAPAAAPAANRDTRPLLVIIESACLHHGVDASDHGSQAVHGSSQDTRGVALAESLSELGLAVRLLRTFGTTGETGGLEGEIVSLTRSEASEQRQLETAFAARWLWYSPMLEASPVASRPPCPSLHLRPLTAWPAHPPDCLAHPPRLARLAIVSSMAAPLLLLPPIATVPPGLVSARQALGKPVDHAYAVLAHEYATIEERARDRVGQGGRGSTVAAGEQTFMPPIPIASPAHHPAVPSAPPPTPPLVPPPALAPATPPPAAPPVEAPIELPAAPEAALLPSAAGSGASGGPKGSAADPPGASAGRPHAPSRPDDPSHPHKPSAGEVPSRSDALMAMMASKLAPELRSKVFGFHPG